MPPRRLQLATLIAIGVLILAQVAIGWQNLQTQRLTKKVQRYAYGVIAWRACLDIREGKLPSAPVRKSPPGLTPLHCCFEEICCQVEGALCWPDGPGKGPGFSLFAGGAP